VLVPSVREQIAELFKAGGDTVLDRMHRICVAIRVKTETESADEQVGF